VTQVFELPGGAPQKYFVVNPFKDQTVDVATLHAGETAKFDLKPFEVLVIEALPDCPVISALR
jgi:hypothetical protein